MKCEIHPKGEGTKYVNLKMKHNYLLKIFKIHQGFLDYQVTNSYLLRSWLVMRSKILNNFNSFFSLLRNSIHVLFEYQSAHSALRNLNSHKILFLRSSWCYHFHQLLFHGKAESRYQLASSISKAGLLANVLI